MNYRPWPTPRPPRRAHFDLQLPQLTAEWSFEGFNDPTKVAALRGSVIELAVREYVSGCLFPFRLITSQPFVEVAHDEIIDTGETEGSTDSAEPQRERPRP